MAFYFREYWPQPKVGQLVINDQGIGADNKPISFITWNSGDDKVFYQEDYHDNQWKATWVNDYYDWRGLVEKADIYPKRKYQVWTDYRTVAFKPGKEIFWGYVQNVGDEFNSPIEIDPITSTKFEWPQKGNQYVKFCNQYSLFKTADGKKTYNDVIEVIYDQSFGSSPAAGARSFFAKGLGIVQLTWRYDGKDVGGPLISNIVTKNGKIVNKYPVLT